MNWNEYKALAIRTESIPTNSFEKVPYDIDAFGPGDMFLANKSATRLLHATMGICTELAELEDGQGAVNAVEEVGDVLWYLAIADDVIGWYKYNRISDQKANLYWVGELNDAMKRHLFYGAELNIDKMITACVAIYRELVVALADREFLIEMAMEANITKLEKRFPNKYFDAQAAVTRDVENELSHIDPQLDKWAEIRKGWGKLLDGEVIKPYHPELSVKRSRKDLGRDILERLGCTEDELHQAVPNAEEHDVALFLDPAIGLTLQVFHQDADLTGNPFAGSIEIPTAETAEELVELVKAKQGGKTVSVDIDKLIEEAQAPLTVKEFNAVLARGLTDYQYTQTMKGLAFIISTNLRNEGAMLEARAYDSMYRDCGSLAVASADASLYSMWKRLGYPFQSEADVRGKLEVWK